MPLTYLIPGVRKQIDQGPSTLDIFIPVQRQVIQSLEYRYPSSVTKYIDISPIIVSQDVFTQKQIPQYLTGPYIISSRTEYIDQGPIVQDQQIFRQKRLPEPFYNTVYSIPPGSKNIDVAVNSDVYPRQIQPYSLVAYQAPSWNPKQVHVTPFVPQQTYIFPLQKPIQEYYQNLNFLLYRGRNVPQLDTPVIITSGNALLACVDTGISWQDHFINNGWTSPQAQITAGYAIYIEPSKTTGSYQEIFDFGSIISNIIAVVNWNQTAVVGSVTTTSTTLETSTNGITWSAPTLGTSIFAQSLRYVRLTMNFVGATDKSLAIYNNLQCLLNVHREQDGGQANVFAADVGGTTVSFNKAFKALDALTVTPLSTLEQKAVYDFAFPPNPTTFKVLLFNAAGARVDGLITWVARGIF